MFLGPLYLALVWFYKELLLNDNVLGGQLYEPPCSNRLINLQQEVIVTAVVHVTHNTVVTGYTVLFIHESIGIVIKYSCMIHCNVNTIVARIIPCMISCMTVAPGV